MPLPQNTPLSQKAGRLSDKRIILLALSAILLCAELAGRIAMQGLVESGPNPSWQLLARQGDLFLAKPSGQSQGRMAAELTPFFFQPIPVNFADAELIATIKGIGPRMANRIVQIRAREGFLTSAEALERVPGIGPKRIRQLQDQFSFRTRP